MVKVLYLVHDLSDATVRKRVMMLRAGGADVFLAGFHRGNVGDTLEGVPVLKLGRTFDGNFAQRTAQVASVLVKGLGKRLAGFRPDVVMARNLEMLAVAANVRLPGGRRPRLVYEILDIHRLLLARGPLGAAMRGLERALLARASLVLTSSPAFVENYLGPIQKVRAPISLLENKVLQLRPGAAPERQERDARPSRDRSGPLVIGWFGALRCARSLALLAAFSRAMGGRYEIVLRGRPAYGEFADFDGFVANEPFMRFEGPYRAPEDLARIYGEVDFVWAIDFFEERLNSRWLLPNRVYEGCLHGGVPIAAAGTETARFLRERGIGAVLESPTAEALAALLAEADLDRMRAAVLSLDERALASGPEDCAALVSLLGCDRRREADVAVAAVP